MEAIRTDALTKHYPVGFWRQRSYVALDALTIDVRQGEVFGFLGPNGAGKTTTLKLFMQLTYPSSGSAEILGRPVGDVSVKRRIGYLPENPYFYDYLTAEELLRYFAGLFGYTAADRRRRVAALLDEVGIGAERRLQLRKFSKGMLQRVGIAQAIINDPEVVFFDEPMSGLDPMGRREIRELILRLRNRGCTVFFSSHVLSDAEALCSRVAILVAGRLAAAGELSEILAFKALGWELVVGGLDDAVLETAKASGHIERATPLGGRRYALHLPPSVAPDRLVADLVSQGAELVSVNPIRETLEDFYVRQIGAVPHDRGLAAALNS
jgi:ABC-2 type transport system ATP-binding protein